MTLESVVSTAPMPAANAPAPDVGMADASEHKTVAEDDVEIECTQHLDDDVEVVKTEREDDGVLSSSNTITKKMSETPPAPVTVVADASESLVTAGEPEPIRHFTSVFGPLWRTMLAQGWQTAAGPETEFVSMPGTQFFNFRPNINVFDAKSKAVWKWIESAGREREQADASMDDAIIWDTLWPVAAAHFGWYTMNNGAETWYVKPNTSFTEFQPNVTIFQSKKLAVLQCLSVAGIRISLGDSVEGPQVVDFSALFTKPIVKSISSNAPAASVDNEDDTMDSFTTPPPKKSTTKDSGKKRKLSISASKATPPAKKSSSTKKSSSATKKPTSSPALTKSKSKVSSTPASAKKKKKVEPPLVFHVPEFKCTFGLVYQKLQNRGWYHRAGKFEYDYFSPAYTKEAAILNGNYFQSTAELESFLKDSGLWGDIESELHEEHLEKVEQLRRDAEERRQRQREKQAEKAEQERVEKERTKARAEELKRAKMESATKTPKTPKSPSKAKKAKVGTMSRPGGSPSGFASEPAFKVTMGKVVGKLVKRGWHYKPGRFEYDYFKPGTNAKTAILNEDYFQSAAELETHLKVSGLWSEIAAELQEEHYAEQEREALKLSQEDQETSEPSAKRVLSIGNSAQKPAHAALGEHTSTQDHESTPTDEDDEEVLSTQKEREVAAVSNDIWSNSHQFDFERY